MSSLEQTITKIRGDDTTDDSDSYICMTQQYVSFGRYIWCGNSASIYGSGYYLNNNLCSSDIYGDARTHMLLLTVMYNKKLYNDTDIIQLYDHTGFLFGYSIGKLNENAWFTSKKIKQHHIGTDIILQFKKWIILTPNTKEKQHSNHVRKQSVTIYEKIIHISQPIQYSNNSICNICLDDVDKHNVGDNKYLTHCGHLFHMNCFISYVKSKNAINPTHPRCNNEGCICEKPDKVNCPVCNKKIIKP